MCTCIWYRNVLIKHDLNGLVVLMKELLVKHRASDDCTYFFYTDSTYSCLNEESVWTVKQEFTSQWLIKGDEFHYKHDGQDWAKDSDCNDAKGLIKAIETALLERYLLNSDLK